MKETTLSLIRRSTECFVAQFASAFVNLPQTARIFNDIDGDNLSVMAVRRMLGTVRDDVRRTIIAERFAKLLWASGRNGFRIIETAVNDLLIARGQDATGNRPRDRWELSECLLSAAFEFVKAINVGDVVRQARAAVQIKSALSDAAFYGLATA